MAINDPSPSPKNNNDKTKQTKTHTKKPLLRVRFELTTSAFPIPFQERWRYCL